MAYSKPRQAPPKFDRNKLDSLWRKNSPKHVGRHSSGNRLSKHHQQLGLARSHHSAGDLDQALACYGQLIQDQSTPRLILWFSLYERGVVYEELGDDENELNDFHRLAAMPGLTDEMLGATLISRSSIGGNSSTSGNFKCCRRLLTTRTPQLSTSRGLYTIDHASFKINSNCQSGPRKTSIGFCHYQMSPKTTWQTPLVTAASYLAITAMGKLPFDTAATFDSIIRLGHGHELVRQLREVISTHSQSSDLEADAFDQGNTRHLRVWMETLETYIGDHRYLNGRAEQTLSEFAIATIERAS